MKMSGEQRIAAPKQRVWEALNDPDVLKRSIPGCQTLEKEGDDRLRATVAIKIGPMDARFAGAVTLSDLDAPNSCTISGEGQGGAAGFAKGNAKVKLAEEGSETILSYDVDAQVGGRLAQLGGPIIDATAKQIAGSFFKKFGEIVAPPPPKPEAAPAKPAAAAASGAPAEGEAPSLNLPIGWMLALVVAFFVGFIVGGAGAADPISTWAGLAIGLLVIVVAAAGFEFGRRAGAPIVVLDPAQLAKVLGKAPEREE